MKKLFSFAVAVTCALAITSCKSVEMPADLQCNPNPLTVVGNKIDATVSGTFEQKTFGKKGTLVVTPVLRYAGKEVKGTPQTYVGQKVKENGKTIAYKAGGKYEMPVSFDYAPDMKICELYLQFDATYGKKKVEIPEVKVADGLVLTAKRSSADDLNAAPTPDKFQRVIQEKQEAEIRFLIQQAALRSSETGSQSIKDLEEAMKAAKNDERKNISGIEVWGYASPDGSVELNEKLSEQREANASKFIAQKVKKNKVQAGIDTKTTAEDWEGFQQLMEASNMQDKDLVLRVLSMYSDPEEREAHIKNLSSVYENIAEDILPQLRRARITMTTELTGKTDDEISKLAKEDASQLNVEELLYAATLTGDNAEKAAIYEQCIKQFPNDYRAYNNLGLMKAAEGNYSAASEFYEKALKIDANNADVNYNAGIAAMAQGKLDDAQAYFGKAAGTTGDLNSALGTLYTMKGDYKNASKSFGSAVSNNAAIQQILNGDYATARTTLNSVKNPNSTTYYMQAVVGARTNDREAVLSNLKTAIAKDSGVKELVQNDIEFTAFAQDADFQALIK